MSRKPTKWWWEYPRNVWQTRLWMSVNDFWSDDIDRVKEEPWDYTLEFLSSGGGPGRVPDDYRRNPLPSG